MSRASSPGLPSISLDYLSKGKDSQKNTFQSDVAASGIIPLAQGMSAVSGVTNAYAYRFKAEGERNIGIGRGAPENRFQLQMRVHCLHNVENSRIFGQSA